MTTPEQVEDNKRRAVKGWIAQPPPVTPEPLPKHHIDKWRRINGQGSK